MRRVGRINQALTSLKTLRSVHGERIKPSAETLDAVGESEAENAFV